MKILIKELNKKGSMDLGISVSEL